MAVSPEAVCVLLEGGADPLAHDRQRAVCHEVWRRSVPQAALTKMITLLKRSGAVGTKDVAALLWHSLYRNSSNGAFDKFRRRGKKRNGLDDLRSTVLLGSMVMQYKRRSWRRQAITQLLAAPECGEWALAHRSVALLMLSSVLTKIAGGGIYSNNFIGENGTKTIEHWQALAPAIEELFVEHGHRYAGLVKPNDMIMAILDIRNALVKHADWPAAVGMLSQISEKLVHLDGESGAVRTRDIILGACLTSIGSDCLDDALKQAGGCTHEYQNASGQGKFEAKSTVGCLADILENTKILKLYGLNGFNRGLMVSREAAAAIIHALCMTAPSKYGVKLADVAIASAGNWTRDDWAALDQS